MPKSSWSICVSGTIRVPIKRFCLPWFPRFDFFFSFSPTPTPPLENSTLLNEIVPFPPPGERTRTVEAVSISTSTFFFFFFSFSLSLSSEEEEETGLVVPRFHSSLQVNGYRGGLPCRERRVYPFNRGVGKIESVEAWRYQDFQSTSSLYRITRVK